ncbi:MAG: DUF6111 family protein [Rickettsiales bacterium]
MIRLLLTRFWPAFIPFFLYGCWLLYRYHLIKKQGEAPELASLVTRTPLFITTLASLLILIACFLWLGISQPQETDGHYIPPHQENGKIVPGHVEP